MGHLYRVTEVIDGDVSGRGRCRLTVRPNEDTTRIRRGFVHTREARLTEQVLAEYYGTYIGRDGKYYRGNRQWPLEEKKMPEYQDYRRRKLLAGVY